MQADREKIKHLQERLNPIFRRYSIRKAILFGSFARGEQTRHSDVDLIVIQDTTVPFLKRYEPILAELNQAVGDHPVEALIYTPQEIEHIQHRPFIRQALPEGIVLYEQE
ncbi:MAG: nucleotidyltransferase [Anaerolineae bacterium]|jgi:predicted nucleotidyltransferase|nr:MAG: nucleotidyltransferase [Anaerolineae bacterium]